MLRVFASRGVFASRAVLATRSAGDVARRGAYKDREATAEKEFALKRDREALEKLRAQLRAEEERVAEEHGPSAVRDDVAEPSVKSGQEDGSISMNEFLEFRKEVVSKVRDLEDELVAVKYKLKKKE